jgi:hypothetical protein
MVRVRIGGSVVTDIQRYAESITALTVGWNERIEYVVSICGNREARAKTIRHDGLLAQLKAASTSKPVAGAKSERGAPNKPASRPPGNMAPLNLIDTIYEEAQYLHDEIWCTVKGVPPVVHEQAAYIHHLGILVAQAGEYPELVRNASSAARSWVTRAKVMLGHQRPTVMLADKVCGECGGALSVADDASTDVKCAGTPDSSPCGVIYRQEEWVAMLPVLVTTPGAVTYLVGERASAYERRIARQRIYAWSSAGVLTRHGGKAAGAARWDVRELENAKTRAIA